METPQEGRITEVPLFPLDIVLFPQMVVPLHIFEQRYRIMIQRCLRDNTPFGIVLSGGKPGGAEMVRVGCMARIIQSERLDDGCMNIHVMGAERFRLLDTHDNHPYRTGLIEILSDAPSAESAAEPLVAPVQEALRDYLMLQLARLGKRVAGFELPDDPLTLSFTASCVLPIGNQDKQNFLEMTDTTYRLKEVREVLRRAISQLEQEVDETSLSATTTWTKMTPARFKRYRCPN